MDRLQYCAIASWVRISESSLALNAQIDLPWLESTLTKVDKDDAPLAGVNCDSRLRCGGRVLSAHRIDPVGLLPVFVLVRVCGRNVRATCDSGSDSAIQRSETSR